MPWTSAGHVALHSSVWRSGRICAAALDPSVHVWGALCCRGTLLWAASARRPLNCQRVMRVARLAAAQQLLCPYVRDATSVCALPGFQTHHGLVILPSSVHHLCVCPRRMEKEPVCISQVSPEDSGDSGAGAGRAWRTMVWICGSKPMSSMRSASSSTRYVTRRRLVTLDSSISIRRPGVAITISTPPRRSRACGPLGAPPYTHLRGRGAPAMRAAARLGVERGARRSRARAGLARRGRGARVLYVRARPELGALLLDLHRQLARGRQDQHDWPVVRRCAPAPCNVVSGAAQHARCDARMCRFTEGSPSAEAQSLRSVVMQQIPGQSGCSYLEGAQLCA